MVKGYLKFDGRVRKMNDQVKPRQTEANDKRTEHAFDTVKTIAGKDKNFQREFRSAARSFPTIVHNNGLSAAIAFLGVKMSDKDKNEKDNQHDLLYDALKGWLVEIGRVSISENETDKKAKVLLEAVIKIPRDEYRIITEEVMVYSQWIKRFAEGMLSKDG